jgi:hypothetical protein
MQAPTAMMHGACGRPALVRRLEATRMTLIFSLSLLPPSYLCNYVTSLIYVLLLLATRRLAEVDSYILAYICI